jgi:hypothetical protein
VLTGGEGRQWGIAIESMTEGNIDGRHTSSGVAYMRGGEEIGWFCLCGGEWPRRCPFYRVNGRRGGGSTQVVVGHFKSFDYGSGRVK